MGEIKAVFSSSGGISLIVNVIVRVDFEPASYDVVIHHVINYTTRTSASKTQTA